MMYLDIVLRIGLRKGPKKSIAHISKVRLWFMDIKRISCGLRGLPNIWNLLHFKRLDCSVC